MTDTIDPRWGRNLVEELRRRKAAGTGAGAQGTRGTGGTRPTPRPPARSAVSPSTTSQPVTPPRSQHPEDMYLVPDQAPVSLASDQLSDAARAERDVARAKQMLEQATWAGQAYAHYDKVAVDRIVAAVAQAAEENAVRYAEWAVAETGFGVVDHKIVKNVACSAGLLEHYAGADYVTPRVDPAAKIVEIPRPAGVVLAIAPATNPVATVYFKVLLALMTRNAVVVSPHPSAAAVSLDAARTLAVAAEEAGAPLGIIQCVPDPTIPLVEALMEDERTSVIVATGGTGVVRAAYSSGNPALGVGPGNVPVFVDHTADLRAAATAIVASKAFDNSVLCTNESVLIVEEDVADALLDQMQRAGAHLLTADEVDQLATYMFPMGRLNTGVVGRDASAIAAEAGIRTNPRTKVLLAPFEVPVPEEMMTHEKLSPVLGVLRVADVDRGIDAAASIIRIAGAGHSAAIHSADPATVMAFAAAVPVLRVSVNVGNSTGSSGLDTHLAPSMTIGTGFVGRSSIGDNLEPGHLVNWSRVAYNADEHVPMPEFRGRDPWREPDHAVPRYPWPSNDPHSELAGQAPSQAMLGDVADAVTATISSRALSAAGGGDAALRAEIRRLVDAELARFRRG